MKDVYIEGCLSSCGQASTKEEALDILWKQMPVSAKLKRNKLKTEVTECDTFFNVEI